jgi:hypothetical protein
VANPGPTPTPGPITIIDPLPDSLTYVSATGQGWMCSASGHTVTCTRPGQLAVGATSSVTLTVLVGPAAVPTVLNTATANAPGTPPTSASDTAPVPAPAIPPAPDSPPAASGTGALSFTGIDVALSLLAALGLMSLGALLVAATRKRRPRTRPTPTTRS